jgi:hypothetical protein
MNKDNKPELQMFFYSEFRRIIRIEKIKKLLLKIKR